MKVYTQEVAMDTDTERAVETLARLMRELEDAKALYNGAKWALTNFEREILAPYKRAAEKHINNR